MTDTLLELARLEAGDTALEKEPVDLAALVRKRADHVRSWAVEAEKHLEIEADDRVPVMGDTNRLAQVLDNLISNALQHTDAGGRITITVNQTPEEALLVVADTGTGIPKDEIPRIFERFYRGDQARGGRGTGLGLAIVKEIVNAHGGTVSAESVVGVGSKFTVRLPRPRKIQENKKAG
jgi:two-component system sensor histidine kinase BaeS